MLCNWKFVQFDPNKQGCFENWLIEICLQIYVYICGRGWSTRLTIKIRDSFNKGTIVIN